MAKHRNKTPVGVQSTSSARNPRSAHPWLLIALAVGLLAAGGAAWYLLGGPATADFRRTADQNVLLITIDTLRGDALSGLGGKAATPNLNRLASLGQRFDFAHSHAVVTLPSHASILTGLYPYQHGIRDNTGYRLSPDIPTLATALRSRGMPTAAFIGAFALDSRFGLNVGFDVYDERYGKSNLNAGFNMAERRADAVVAPAVEWIGRQQRPWFTWVHVFDPHAPYRPPAPFDARYAGQPYFGEVAFTDAALGPLLDAARDPSGRPTLVIVTGDHGESLGEHGEMTHGLFAYEATLHVPLIVAQLDKTTVPWQGNETSPGGARVSRTPARHVDIMPTVFNLLGLPTDARLPGTSLLKAGEAGRASYFEAMSTSLNRGWAPLSGVLVDREKYIELPIPELYDLQGDSREQVNLADRQPDARRTLAARLQGLGAKGPGRKQSEDPQARARLQALGYVSGTAAPKERYTEDDDPKRLVAIDRQIHEAVELYERGEPRAAIAVYEQVVRSRPSMALAYEQLAMLQWEVGDPARAIVTLREALRNGADSTGIRTRLGMYLAETGNVAEALPVLEAAASGTDADLDALNALGIAQVRSRRPAEAVRTFERILRLNPSNTTAMENLGSLALEEGRLADARRWLTLALESDPRSAQAHNGLGVVELKGGNREAAIEHWRQAVASDPANFDALYNVATELVAAGRPAAARPYLEQFARTAPPAFYADDIRRVREMLARLER